MEKSSPISRRTKEVLEAKRQREGEWRVSNLDQEAREKGGATMAARAAAHNRKAAQYATPLRAQGLSYAKVADLLNSAGYRGMRGGEYTSTQVKRILERAAPGPTD